MLLFSGIWASFHGTERVRKRWSMGAARNLRITGGGRFARQVRSLRFHFLSRTVIPMNLDPGLLLLSVFSHIPRFDPVRSPSWARLPAPAKLTSFTKKLPRHPYFW